MTTETRTDGGGSSLRRLLLLALTFAVGYVLGARGGGDSEWERSEREPTRITIDDESDEGEESGEVGA